MHIVIIGGLAVSSPVSKTDPFFRPRKPYIFERPVLRACFVDGMKWGLTEVSQKPHRRPTEAQQKTPNLDDFRVILKTPILDDFRVFF